MTPLKIDVVAGARPNFMKVAPILKAFKRTAGAISARLVHTGQHYDDGMSEIFFRQLGIPIPDVNLGVGSGPHGKQTAAVLAAYEATLVGDATSPDGVVVVGDVNSTMACALAAVKLGIPVAHVEAGLRSFDRTMPEEINRVVTDTIADLLLVSDPEGCQNLMREGIPEGRFCFVGNVMIDTLVEQLPAARELNMPGALGLNGSPFAYVTLHRPRTVDDPDRLRAHIDLLQRIAERVTVIFPMHPRTRQRLERFGLLERAESALRLLEPLGYRESLSLMASAAVVLTDSGGIQEETTFLRVPCLTLRPNTERPCTVSHGTNTVVGDDLSSADSLVTDVLADRYKQGEPVPGWDGRAADRITQTLLGRWASRCPS